MIKNKKKSLLSLILCVAFLCASFLATLPLFRTAAPTYAATKSVTWNSTEQGYANAEVIGEVHVNDDITLTFDKAGAGNPPAYYTADGGAVRVYASGALKVKGATNVSITKIVITYGSGDKTNSVSQSVGNFDGSTWTGETNEVTFTIGGGQSGHRRFKILEITYNGGEIHEHGTIVDTWDAEEPTCTEAGHLAAYKCDCGLWFEDEACTIEIGDDDDVLYWCMEGGDGYLAPLGHDFEHAYVRYREFRDYEQSKQGYWCVTAELVCGRDCGEVGEIIKFETITHAGIVIDTDATCTEPQKGHLVATFTDPDFPPYAGEPGSIIPDKSSPLGHTDIGATVEYSWSSNTCTATKRCGRCHEISDYEIIDGEYVRDTDPTCLNNARGHYEATFTKDWVTVKTQSSTHGAVEEHGSALGHDDEHATIKYFWSGDMCTASKCCGRCGTPLESETKKADYVKDTDATCQHNEKGHYTVTFATITTETKSTGTNSVEIADTKVEHTASAVEYTWEDDQCTATIHCTVCGEELDHETVTAEHVVDTPSTDCKTNAKGHYKATFTRLSTATKATPANSVEFEGTQKPHQFNDADVKYTWFGQYCTATVKCSNCDETLAETVLGEEVVDTPASCQSNKKGHYTATFTKFASTSTDANSVDFPDTKLPHEYDVSKITYAWNGPECYATVKCSNCDETLTEKGVVEYRKDTDATCSSNEKGHYKATFKVLPQTEVSKYTSPNSVEVDGTKLNHEEGTIEYVWDGNKCIASIRCTQCHEELKHAEATGTFVQDTPATCSANEKGHYTATFTEDWVTEKTQTSEANSAEKPNSKLAHEFDYEHATYSWFAAQCTAQSTCKHCDEKDFKTVYGVYVKDVDATCTEAEKGHYEAFESDAHYAKQSTDYASVTTGNKLGHTTQHIDGQASTCSEYGWKDYYQCDRCEKYFEDEVGNKLIGDATALEAWKQNAGKIEKLPHTLELVEGQPATCTEDGWTDCYKCSVCGEYCADEAGKVVIGDETAYNNWKVGNGKIKASGHALELVEGQPATCTETGWKDYYHCVVEGCDKLFEDSKGTTEITDLPSWKANDGKIETIAHNPVYVEGQESTCQEHGWYHYYQCSMCNKYFEDEDGTTPIANLDAWKIGAGQRPFADHALQIAGGKASTCEEHGWKDYYQCPDCFKYFEDEDGTREIEDLAAWKVGAGQLPLAPHTLTLVEGQAPTCVEDGWKDYYHCEVCDEYFEDEDGASRIEDLDAWKVGAGKVEATGHKLTKIDGKVATCTEPGWKDYYQCSVCQHYFEDEDGTTPIANLDAWKVGAGKVVVPHTEVVTYEWNGRICTATKSCEVCHQVLDTESIVGTYVKDFDATCVANEKGHYTATFTRLSTETKVTIMFDVEGTALGHEYEITYTWNKDKTECVAEAHCVRDPEHSDSDIQETASISAGTIKIEGFYFVARFESEEFEEQRIPLLNNVEIIAVAACGTVILICLIVGIAAGIKSSRKPQAQLNRKAKAEARKEAKAEKKAKAEAKKQAQEQKKAEAKAKAEEKAKADAERKAKAEADKKAKAEANKQANADKEAKAEAKRQALEQKKADAEAKKQAKLEAKERKKAEAEAKKQAKDKKNVGQPEEDASVKAEVNKLMKERLQSEIRVERLKQISESLKKAKTENPEAAKERISLAKEKLAELKSNKLTKKK